MQLLHITTVPMSLTFLRGQAGFIASRGFELSALSSPGPALDAFGEEEGVPVYPVEMPRRITPLKDLRALRGIRRAIRQARPDVVHAHTPKGGLLGMIAARFERIPHRIYHMRGLPFMGAEGSKRTLLRQTEQVACRMAHRVLCVSASLRDVAVAERLCPPDKIRVPGAGSGQGVDVARFDPSRAAEGSWRGEVRAGLGIPGDAVVVGFVGRLVRDKGIVELAAAWARVREDEPSTHLMLVGPFEPFDPVPAEVRRRLEEDHRVHFVGENWDTPRLYSAMDIVVLPTYREGFPNVPLEAAAMGLPVVATAVVGCVDAVADGRTGTLVPVRDAGALANAIQAYVRDDELREAHGRAGRRRVETSFRREVVWEAILREYEALVGSGGTAP